MYKLVMHEFFQQSIDEEEKNNIYVQLLAQQLFDIVYLAPTRLSLAQKIFHLKSLMNFKKLKPD